MKRESFQFTDEPLRNVTITDGAKILQLCLKKNQCVAKRRMQESAMMVVVLGSICVESKEQNELLKVTEAVILESAEEHAVVALEDSVVLLILMPKVKADASPYRWLNEENVAAEDWKERIVPELRMLALEHEHVLSVLNEVQEYDLATFDEAMKAVSVLISNHMVAEEELLFPLLVPYLGGADVGPVPKLLSEHETVRAQYRKCMELRRDLTSDSGQVHELFQQVDDLTELLLGHMEKEDFHLLPMAGRLLSSSEKASFLKQWQNRYDSIMQQVL